MTESEAINVLQLNTPFVASKEVNEAVDVAINALEKQIAKKPTLLLYVFKCPNCKDNFLRTQQKFCDECGQKLDWRV